MDRFEKLNAVSSENLPLELEGDLECAPQTKGKQYKGIPISEVTKTGGKTMKA